MANEPRKGGIPKVVEKGIGISYPIVESINEKRRIYYGE
jgi:hypothetical protein